MERKRVFNISLILLLIFSLPPFNIISFASDNWIIDGDTVYIDDTNVYLSATPHTIKESTWVTFQLRTKNYSGDIDAVWFFNTNNCKPRKPVYYKIDDNDWEVLTKNFIVENIDYENMTKAYSLENINIQNNINYSLKCFIDAKFNASGKYWWGVKPSGMGWNKGYYIDPWFDLNWSYYMPITINHDYIDTDLSNFPVLVSIPDDTGDMCDGGDSVRFLHTDNTTEYYYEIEKWEDGADRLVWVNITSISSSVDTVFLMYYNNSAASDNQTRDYVWDSGYKMVSHMAATNSTTNILDSTSGHNNGTKKANTEPARNTSIIGYGQNYDGSDDYINWGNIGDTFFGFSCWIKPMTVIDKDSSAAEFINVRTGYLEGAFGSVTGALADETFTLVKNTGGDTRIAITEDITAQWHLLSVYWDGSQFQFYLDLASDLTEITSGVTPQQTMTNLLLGKYGASDVQDMDIDEFRISTTNRNTSWINASYHNIQTSGFLVYGGSIYRGMGIPTDFVATTISIEKINLTWTKDINATHTVIQKKEGSYAETLDEGENIYNDTGTSYDDTDVTRGIVYYYSAWSYNSTTNNYSGYAEAYNLTEPLNPTDITMTINGTTMNITWTKGTLADNTLIIRKTGSFPTSLTDGTTRFNNTNTSTDDTGVTTSHFYRFYSWNSTVNQFSTGVNIPFGSITISVYDENTSNAITNWDVFISNEEGTNTYESLGNSNPAVIASLSLPYGDNTMIRVNATYYDSKLFIMDISLNTHYTLDCYLSESNDTHLYVFYVVNEYDIAIEDANVYIKRYINDSEGYQNVSILRTDANGQFSLHLIPNENYLIEISKTGYETEYSPYIPDPDYHGPYYPTTFRLMFSREEPDIITPTEGITFNGTINTTGVIKIWYDDFYSNTEDTAIYIYEYHNAVLVLNHTDTRTNNHAFSFTDTGYNTSRLHKLILFVNRTNAGYAKMSFFIYPLRTPTTETTIEGYFEDVFGSFELGWVRTFLIFCPCLFFLIVFGASHAGLGILTSGLYLGFTTFYLSISETATIAGESVYIFIASLLVVAGFLVIVLRRGHRAI